MTVCVAARGALGSSARHGMWLVLFAAAVSACVGDTGDLFPATSAAVETFAPETSAPETFPGNELGATEVDGAPGTQASVGSELSPPIVLDTGSDSPSLDEPEGPALASEDDTPAADEALDDEVPGDEVLGDEATAGLPLDPELPSSDGADGVQACARVASPLLLDFAGASDDPTRALFGDFEAVLSGGTYVYPQAPEAAAPLLGLRSDVSAGDWHIQGSVAQQSGFGLFLDCQLLDASSFAGLAFRVSGRVEGAGSITLLVGTASNEVSSAWRLENDGSSVPSSGRCTPARSEFDGTCNVARLEIPVSRLAREVIVPFAALAGGSPEPGVNPAEITTIGWALPSPTNLFGDAQPYAVDLRLDDIRFVEAAALP